MPKLSPDVSRNLWIAAMIAASTATTLVLACATPFPALAAIAALHVRRGGGVALMMLAWLAAQITGFGLLQYPANANSIGWALALGAAAVGALFAADIAMAALPRAGAVMRLSLGYVAAYITFKAIVLLGAVVLGSGWAAFAPDILARQFVRDGAILAGLALLHRLLAMAGVRGDDRAVYA